MVYHNKVEVTAN